MTTATPSAALVMIQPNVTDAERRALAGYLAGYRGLTREAYALDLRQFTTWCRARSLNLFAVRRADIEGFACDLEARGRARATVTRRLCAIAGFCKCAVEEELLEHSPAAHTGRPPVDYESHAVALDRDELGALLVAAGLGWLDAVTPRRRIQPLDPGDRINHPSRHPDAARPGNVTAGLGYLRRTVRTPSPGRQNRTTSSSPSTAVMTASRSSSRKAWESPGGSLPVTSASLASPGTSMAIPATFASPSLLGWA